MSHLLFAVSALFCPAVSAATFEDDSRALTAAPHRLTGTAQGAAAADYLAARLTQSGVDLVIEQRFTMVQSRVERCELRLEGSDQAINLEPMRANGIIAPITTTFDQGLSGPVVHLDRASVAELLDQSVRGAIVVMNYNCGRGWMRAFRLGAKAVIFVRREPTEAWHTHYIEANVNLPRYFLIGPPEQLPAGANVTIDCRMTWEPVVGRNVFGFVRGTDPVFANEKKKEEVLIIAAPFDSYGEVPRRSPGARAAANCAGVLKLADQLTHHRPRRHVLLAFFDGQSRGHEGSSAFYRALEPDEPGATIKERRQALDDEQDFLKKLQALLKQPRPLEQNSDVKQRLLQRLRDIADACSHEVKQAMYDVRTQMHQLRKASEPQGAAHQIEEMSRQLAKWQIEKDGWSDVRRALGRDKTRSISSASRARLNTLLDAVRQDIRLRTAELEGEQDAIQDDVAVHDLIGEHLIALHTSLLLGDTTPSWGVIIGGNTRFHSYRDNPELYGKLQATFLRAYRKLESLEQAPAHFVVMSANQRLARTRALLAAPFLVHSGEIAGLLGIFNLVLGTCQERLAHEGTPDDVLDRLDLKRIESQVDEIGSMLFTFAGLKIEDDEPDDTVDARYQAVADQRGLSLHRTIMADRHYVTAGFKDGQATGAVVMGTIGSSAVPNTPLPNVLVQFWAPLPATATFDPAKPYAFDHFQIKKTNHNGVYTYGPLHRSWAPDMYGFAAVFDQSGRVIQAAGSAQSGKEWGHMMIKRLDSFACRSGYLMLPPQKWATGEGGAAGLMSSPDNAVIDEKKSFVRLSDGVAYWYCDDRVDKLKLFKPETIVALNTGDPAIGPDISPGSPQGLGFAVDPAPEPVSTAMRSAVDLWRLNESRLAMLRQRDIVDASLSELHGRAQDLILAAGAEPSDLRSEALAASALYSARPVYHGIRLLIDDLVVAVLILLAMSVPFAFALERLIIGATRFTRQIVWTAIIFAVTFVTHYLTHPSFAIANTPTIIFLGFALMVMAVLVMWIIMRRFETELKLLQGTSSTEHTVNVSRTGSMIAAMMMGISTMRRRPLRTGLSAVTIILLTYTILTYASFGTRTGVLKFLAGPNPDYRGVWVHEVSWRALGPDLLDVFAARWRHEAIVCQRRWLLQTDDMLLTLPDGVEPVSVRGVLGLDLAEIERRQDLTQLFGEMDHDTAFITEAVARGLGVVAGDRVILGGKTFRIGRVLDPISVAAIKDMDASSILPVDFTNPLAPQREAKKTQDKLTKATNWQAMPPDSVVIVSAQTAAAFGGQLVGITLLTQSADQAANIAEQIARMIDVPVTATRPDGVQLHMFGTVLSASGAKELLFPILLGGLVIFGTMLGSITDRQSEIYTFSAIGLAPRHVATLFFAEALIYALIGGQGGYLLAQGLNKLLGLAATYGLVAVPQMNMSTTNTIVTILIVMVTVLVSSIYPAIKASQSANPGLMRMWRPSKPDGDVLDLVFPFTISQYDVTGAVSFLKEHFDNQSDAGLGRFIATDTQLVRGRAVALGLDAKVALSPYDLGVSQTFNLRSEPSEIAGIDEIHIKLQRLSGQPKDWQRLTKMFLDDLRMQLLLWRSLPDEKMQTYRRHTLVVLANGE